jgi:CRP-like cAMP-binding protein
MEALDKRRTQLMLRRVAVASMHKGIVPTDAPMIRNAILRALPQSELDPLIPLLERVPLRRRQTLIEPDVPIRDVHFLESGTACVISRTNHHRLVELGMVGRMGVVGVPAVLGVDRSPFRCFVQFPGESLRLKVPQLREAMERSPVLRQMLMNYVQALMTLQAQTILCNTRHSLRQRVARWLLMALDRIDGADVPATHDLLARMLGVRRASVTEAIAELEAAGVIRHSRGLLTVIDRSMLEHTACECYAFIRAEFERLLVPGQRIARIPVEQGKLQVLADAFRLKKE